MGTEALDDFVRIMQETGERDNFSTRPKSYFEQIMNCMGEDCRLYMAYYEGKAIAGTLAIKWGQNVMKYQYGASSNAHRNVYPNYALQWAMMQWGMTLAASAATAKTRTTPTMVCGGLSTALAGI